MQVTPVQGNTLRSRRASFSSMKSLRKVLFSTDHRAHVCVSLHLALQLFLESSLDWGVVLTFSVSSIVKPFLFSPSVVSVTSGAMCLSEGVIWNSSWTTCSIHWLAICVFLDGSTEGWPTSQPWLPLKLGSWPYACSAPSPL